ncbi:ferrochelatase [Bathymodiolus platifrons methanotrophic gill symbiont]|uniref:ferrochelatase n=1 Tax=Bathymodiolus platifrons methanotrophic gill symbiont TaxID=113268 RepID=UPI000B415CBD|nr:ferrochelatase [Bathymodiolus platifrons methanotrophic gill symbiont]MCK5870331.1 ferrochelatase [Methyloprofundus sp.]TXK96317.1 ferrochelatase [Methylococcaceae bacterium CS4]TXK97595.1 ferrochelatase [Methylococcaceae bacterium CS5]TXL05239.1 ferrochelatase [Methylococcaceae bacterium CS1]TXL05620.1 ferrochelatase [Methylococcaceae bacterium CS3]TXL10142.1 ferrochelatase [Methylococcaceae bacterium CS2]TXL14519.1 ferrochelatase [Methylococcaceae bacterium HT4]TXL19837.1 ferrochelatas
MVNKKKGILIVNLGSPQQLTVRSIRRFLRQFLSDSRVVNLPRSLWWFILNFLVLPFRPRKSLKAYAKVWTDRGSPLIYLTQDLTDRLARHYQPEPHVLVAMAMSYGKPSLTAQLRKLRKAKCEQITIVPLYPQYSSTTTASVFDAVTTELMQWRYIPELNFISDYHQHPLYISAITDSVQYAWAEQGQGELLVMSFHGLPDLLTKKGDPYYYQCLKTAELIADQLKLKEDKWRVVFQSRFGKAKWLQPYCIETLMALPEEGFKSIDIICPGFAIDCLETLEEINMANKDIFIKAGGEKYQYIPALNDSDANVKLMLDLIASRGS